MRYARTSLQKGWDEVIVPWLGRTWIRHGRNILIVAAAYMVVAAAGRLLYAFPFLVSDVEPWAAVDLKNRYVEVHRWFAGRPLYGIIENADYPPASYVILWPWLGWLPLTSARWLWAAGIAVAAGVLALITVRESGANTRIQRIFAALLIFSMYPTQMNVFVGQVGLHVMAMLLVGLVWLHRCRGRWWEDLFAATLLLSALVKPTLSVPFFWIVCVLPGRLRPMIFVVLGYGILSILASTFQGAGLLTLTGEWLGQAGSEVTVMEGNANIHKWLALAGLEPLMMPASLIILAGHGLWTFRNREGDFWTVMGVAAIVSRLWIHHRLYDDLLMLIPMISLFRVAATRPRLDYSHIVAGILLALTWAMMHVPTWAFYDLSDRFTVLLEIGQSFLWLGVLVFFVLHARRRKKDVAHPSFEHDEYG